MDVTDVVFVDDPRYIFVSVSAPHGHFPLTAALNDFEVIAAPGWQEK